MQFVPRVKSKLKELVRNMIPKRFWREFRSNIEKEFQNARAADERRLVKVALLQRNVANCEILLNREALLSRLEACGIVAELGVNKGDFSELILEIAKPAKLHLVDTWGSERYHTGLYETVLEKFRIPIAESQILIHRKLSVEAACDFRNHYFDWVYIDTDHTFENTRAELRAFASKVKINGIIAGHDYSMGNWIKSYRYGVIEAVHEFCVESDWELVFLTIEPTEGQSFAIRRIRNPN